jgi:hypothetical protein
MTYTQQIHDCPEHADCHMIVCVDDTTGDMVWASHAPNTANPADRINPDHPAYDHTGPGQPVPVAPTPPGAYPAWAQPTGSADAYPLGGRVSHNSLGWQSNVDANVWEPGVYGWDQLGPAGRRQP